MPKSKTVIMDGAMGTMLMAHGVPPDACLESLNLTRPGLILEIHRSYLDAGAQVLLANTFGGNRARLSLKGLARKIGAVNRAGIRIAREAAGRKRVFASIGPLGQAARRMTFPEMFGIFKEQVGLIEKENPDGYVIETMTSLTEAEAATAATRRISDAPVIALMTRLPRRTNPTKEALELVAATLRSVGADVIGANCGTSPQETFSFLKGLSEADGGPFATRIPAGVPGRLLTPEDFADWAMKFRRLGCTWIGGCCGTTPAHIRALASRLP